MRGNPNLGGWGKRHGYTRQFLELGAFYVSGEWNDVEADDIRDECEARGIPMGYGRVGDAPTQLDDEYVTALFELNRGE
jgi:hypothetical protein